MKTDANQRDRRKYCYFHCDHGHNTGDCINFKDDIETLIRTGHLRQYIKEEKQSRKEESSTHAADDIVEIWTIFRGPSGGGDSNQSRKAYACSTDPKHYVYLIDRPSKEPRLSPCTPTFTEDNARRIQHPHDDVLIVAMTITNRKVYRILIDTGSSADILYSEAF
ncbi:uncharacterized protein LOC131239090 [Magnolia sinica]|uniref:uncharacterized protein LOC131239090 n=1 Tax=Magnolia sinica TaxID=86752 RepID=UPI0026584374|nr:uncharacterized protein LOC131239090 [Magnolia sinica]